MMSNNKEIILCADDFGYNRGVCEGILHLAQHRRLSAVGCMVNAPCFMAYAKQLNSLSDTIQIGLHFNFTEGQFISDPNQTGISLIKLLIKTHSRCLASSLVVQEFNAQLDYFITAIGRLPDFIDGHQHVHQFPIIRQGILTIYEQRLRKNHTYIRSTYPTVGLKPYQFKTTLLSVTGGKKLHQELIKNNIPHNAHFAGIYDFATEPHYQSLFKQWLAIMPHHTLAMCHPAQTKAADDSISSARVAEFNYLSSEQFLEDCQQHQISIS